MPDDRGNRAVAQSGDKPHHVSDQVEKPEGNHIAVVVVVPTGGAPIPALIGRDDVKTLLSERRHHLSPTVGELREAVKQQHARPARGLETGLQHVHLEAVDIVHEPRAYPGGKSGLTVSNVLVFLHPG